MNFNERIERLAELEAKATPGEWVFRWSNYQNISGDYESPSWIETINKEFLEENGRFYGKEICHFNENMFQNDLNDAEFVATLRNEALPLLREMVQALSEAMAENERLKAEAGRTDKAFSKTLKDLVLANREAKRFGNQMVLAVNKNCELQTEIDRLREGIKDVAAKFAEMEKLRSQFYTEKEQAETALLFANRERDALQKRVDDALDILKYCDWHSMVKDAIKILTGEGES